MAAPMRIFFGTSLIAGILAGSSLGWRAYRSPGRFPYCRTESSCLFGGLLVPKGLTTPLAAVTERCGSGRWYHDGLRVSCNHNVLREPLALSAVTSGSGSGKEKSSSFTPEGSSRRRRRNQVVSRNASSDKAVNLTDGDGNASNSYSRNSRLSSATTPQPPQSSRLLLEDPLGRANREMAGRIWNWEQDRRRAASLPRLEYSVRSGLKLVASLAAEKLPPTWQRGTPASAAEYQDDLIQEGLVALLDAFGSYPGTDPLGFEPFATRRIRQALDQALRQHDTTSPPPPPIGDVADTGAHAERKRRAQPQGRGRSLPLSVRNVLQQAQQVATELPAPATLSKVAEALSLPVEQLRDYIELASSVRRRSLEDTTQNEQESRRRRSIASSEATPQTMLSVEGTVEISNPQLQDTVEYVDQDEWELWEGLLLDDGRGTIRRDELVENYVDETLHDEGDDDSWIRHQQNAGRLQDLIPDPSSSRLDAEDDSSWTSYLPEMKAGSGGPATERTLDDIALEELIRSNLSSFLSDTLSDQEQQIVRLAYGLTDSMDPPASQSRIAGTLGMDREGVSKVLHRAIHKLREAYRARYVEPYREDEPTIDSV